jgi:hypothetical protein
MSENEMEKIEGQNEKFPALAEIIDWESLRLGKEKLINRQVEILIRLSLEFFNEQKAIVERGESITSKTTGTFTAKIFKEGAELVTGEIAVFFEQEVGDKVFAEFDRLLKIDNSEAENWWQKAIKEKQALAIEFTNSVVEGGKNTFLAAGEEN